MKKNTTTLPIIVAASGFVAGRGVFSVTASRSVLLNSYPYPRRERR
jgi:hypothetical protein